jgi:hypothetical protein
MIPARPVYGDAMGAGRRFRRRLAAAHRGRRVRRGRRGNGSGRGRDLRRAHWYDPPWESITEGRGLPHTRNLRAMVPVVALATILVLGVALVGATVRMWLG